MTERHLNINEHFTIPEGYIDTFCDQIMDKLPEQPFQPMNIKQRRRIQLAHHSIAAAAALFIISVGTILFFTGSDSDKPSEAKADKQESYSVEDAADYAMIDRTKIYEMITE